MNNNANCFVLGIDAAWTDTEPSGVALLNININGLIEIIKAGRSYKEFLCSSIEWEKHVSGSHPLLNEVINKCRDEGYIISTIALDIPLSPQPITSRRLAENLISGVYGKYCAATHSPTTTRPGKISTCIYNQLILEGYSFSFKKYEKLSFIEVYPHAAIIEFFKLNKRLPYKIQKKNKYWPDKSPEERTKCIIQNLNYLIEALSCYIY